MNISDHEDLRTHILQLCTQLTKHHVYNAITANYPNEN